jgi:hypothetical protein
VGLALRFQPNGGCRSRSRFRRVTSQRSTEPRTNSKGVLRIQIRLGRLAPSQDPVTLFVHWLSSTMHRRHSLRDYGVMSDETKCGWLVSDNESGKTPSIRRQRFKNAASISQTYASVGPIVSETYRF